MQMFIIVLNAVLSVVLWIAAAFSNGTVERKLALFSSAILFLLWAIAIHMVTYM